MRDMVKFFSGGGACAAGVLAEGCDCPKGTWTAEGVRRTGFLCCRERKLHVQTQEASRRHIQIKCLRSGIQSLERKLAGFEAMKVKLEKSEASVKRLQGDLGCERSGIAYLREGFFSCCTRVGTFLGRPHNGLPNALIKFIRQIQESTQRLVEWRVLGIRKSADDGMDCVDEILQFLLWQLHNSRPALDR